MIQENHLEQPLTNFDLTNPFEVDLFVKALHEKIPFYMRTSAYYKMFTTINGSDIVLLITVRNLSYEKVRQSALDLIDLWVKDEVESNPSEQFIESFVSATWFYYLKFTTEIGYKAVYNPDGSQIDHSNPIEDNIRIETNLNGMFVVWHQDGRLFPEHPLHGVTANK